MVSAADITRSREFRIRTLPCFTNYFARMHVAARCDSGVAERVCWPQRKCEGRRERESRALCTGSAVTLRAGTHVTWVWAEEGCSAETAEVDAEAEVEVALPLVAAPQPACERRQRQRCAKSELTLRLTISVGALVRSRGRGRGRGCGGTQRQLRAVQQII
jgi:hypothetical protein